MSRFFILIISISFLFVSCLSIKKAPRNYFLLEYQSENEKKELHQSPPYQKNVLIKDVQISSPYSNQKIIQRKSGPAFSYYENNLWGIDLSEKLADLLQKRLRNYQIFTSIERISSGISNFDYQITIQLRKLEHKKQNNHFAASYLLEFSLKDRKSGKTLLRHQADKDVNLASASLDDFVITFNTEYLQESDNFIKKIIILLNAEQEKE